MINGYKTSTREWVLSTGMDWDFGRLVSENTSGPRLLLDPKNNHSLILNPFPSRPLGQRPLNTLCLFIFERNHGPGRVTGDPLEPTNLRQSIYRSGVFVKKTWMFFTHSSASTQCTTNILIDAKYPHGKIMLGIGVEWGGLIGPWSEWEKKSPFQ